MCTTKWHLCGTKGAVHGQHQQTQIIHAVRHTISVPYKTYENRKQVVTAACILCQQWMEVLPGLPSQCPWQVTCQLHSKVSNSMPVAKHDWSWFTVGLDGMIFWVVTYVCYVSQLD